MSDYLDRLIKKRKKDEKKRLAKLKVEWEKERFGVYAGMVEKEDVFIDFVSDVGKQIVLFRLWLPRFLERNFRIRLSAFTLLITMHELNRPFTNQGWQQFRQQGLSISRLSRDLALLESKGLIRKYQEMTDELLEVMERDGDTSVLEKAEKGVKAYRYAITPDGNKLCQTIIYNLEYRIESFDVVAINDIEIYNRPKI